MTRYLWIGLSVITALCVSSAPALAQKRGGILRSPNIANPPSGSIHEEGTIAVFEPFSPIYNNLMVFDLAAKQNRPDTIIPELATEWVWSEDRTKLTVKLRQGVQWHDGKPFTSADVKCTFDGLSGRRDMGWRKSFRSGWYFNLKDTTTNGDFEATFHLARPQPSFLMMLASNATPVYPCHVSGRDMRQKPIGTGPFKLAEYVPNDHVTVVRNPDYWKPGKPYLDGAEWKVVTNRSTRNLGFAAAEFDKTASSDVSMPLLRDIQSGVPNAVCEVNPFNIQGQLLINREAAPFDNDKIRRAMMLTIDRTAFIDILSEGKDLIGGFLLAPPDGIWGLDAERLTTLPGFGPDVAKSRAEAAAIMRGLGYGPDKPLSIKVSTRDLATYRDPAVILIDQLKHIYIKADLDVLDTSVWFPRMFRKEFQVAMNFGGSAVDDPDITFYEHFACGSDRNFTGYCNPKMQKLFDEQSVIVGFEQRRKLVQEIDVMLQQEGARSTIYQSRMATCWHPYVKGIVLTRNSQYNQWRLEDVWLDK